MRKIKIVAITIVALIVSLYGMQQITAEKSGEQNLVEVESNLVVEEVVWYPIAPDSNLPEDKVINGGPQSSEPSTTLCNSTNTGLPCAIQLRFPNDDAPPAGTATGLTVQDMIDHYEAEIVLDAIFEEPVFTRNPIQ